jgi:outer membrane beta-barrel protein
MATDPFSHVTFPRPRHALPAVAILALVLAAPAAFAQDPAAPAGGADTSAASAPADSAVSAAPAPTAAAVANPRPTVTRKVRLAHEARNVVRSGPGNDYSIVGIYPKGAEFTVIAKSDAWYNIRLTGTETGWIHSSLVKEFDDLSDLQFRANPRLYSRTGSFILSGYAGGYSFDRKSNSLVLGGRAGYYVFDRFQVEAGLGWTHVHRPAEIVESLFGLTLEAEDFPMLFYHLIGTYELLPGRQMVPYVSGGVGTTLMQGESEPSYNFGGGVNVYLSKRTALRWEVRDYRFETGAKNSRRVNNNLEYTLGSVVLF